MIESFSIECVWIVLCYVGVVGVIYIVFLGSGLLAKGGFFRGGEFVFRVVLR